ncbi:hypothetical protein [Cellulomonas fimi]|uniref:Uncharacterized protein n=1 Tax=Cellulomonas fimi TaxID=1708 RepID=A0A7Y0LWS9_CELFI|nr:hypothetical protein [Cellulomonas fimi]NMR19326.1 hypothetical protein [Cellulomonas fimi]
MRRMVKSVLAVALASGLAFAASLPAVTPSEATTTVAGGIGCCRGFQ